LDILLLAGPVSSPSFQTTWAARLSEHLKWGILTTGWIAEQFASDIQLAGLHVAAVGSRSRERARALAARLGVAKAYGSYAELLADPEVDVVYIAPPHPFHAPEARAALMAGKHVLVEKPFTVNAAEARSVVRLATVNKRMVMEAMWTRFLPHMARIRELIADGAIGRITSVHATHMQQLPREPTHRINALSLAGGALLDLGVYPVSFAFDLLGPPTALTAMARMSATGVDAEISLTMKHSGGALSVSTAALDQGGSNRAVVHGTQGRIEIDDVWYCPSSFSVYDAQNACIQRYQTPVQGRGMQYQALALEAAIRSGTPSALMSNEQSIQIMETLDLARQQIGLRYPSDSA